MIAPRVSSNCPLSSIQNTYSSPKFVPIGTSTTSTHSSPTTRYTVSCIEPPVRFVESQHPDGTAWAGSFARLPPRSPLTPPQLPETRVLRDAPGRGGGSRRADVLAGPCADQFSGQAPVGADQRHPR